MRIFVLVTGLVLAASPSWAIDVFDEDLLLRGDANSSGNVNTQDSIAIQEYIFVGSFSPTCRDACDVNDDGHVTIGDSIYLLYFLFQGGQPPPAPGAATCGADYTADSLGCSDSACS